MGKNHFLKGIMEKQYKKKVNIKIANHKEEFLLKNK
jgi:hypothetical protein